MKYDLAIIGSGPAGYEAAITSAKLGAKTCLIEKDKVGGTCLNYGCIPTKTLITSAHLFSKIKNAEEFGIYVDKFSLNFRKIIERKNKIISKIQEGIMFVLNSHKINLVSGEAKILNKNLIEVKKSNGNLENISTEKIIIASGSKDKDVFGVNGKNILNSKQILQLQELPKNLTIIGGGAIGCEFAYIFNIMGVDVSIVEIFPQLLPNFSNLDNRIRKQLEIIFKKNGIKLYLGKEVKEIKEEEKNLNVILKNGEIQSEKVLVCVGRKLNLERLNLEEIGIKLQDGRIFVNEKMETNVSGIYAAGDIASEMQQASVASYQGWIAAENALGRENIIDYNAIPNCIFTSPEIAFVGISEDEANKKNISYKINRFNFLASSKAEILGETEGQIKMILNKDNEEILGVQIIGPFASEIISEVTLLIKKGLKKEDLLYTIHLHPTLSESLREVVKV